MRTNIDIDDKLMKKAMKASLLDTKTKKAVVEEALALMVRIRERNEGLRRLRGKVIFSDGYDYKAMRGDDPVEIKLAPERLERLAETARERRRKRAA